MCGFFVCRDVLWSAHITFVHDEYLIKMLRTFQQWLYANHVLSHHINNVQCTQIREFAHTHIGLFRVFSVFFNAVAASFVRYLSGE